MVAPRLILSLCVGYALSAGCGFEEHQPQVAAGGSAGANNAPGGARASPSSSGAEESAGSAGLGRSGALGRGGANGLAGSRGGAEGTSDTFGGMHTFGASGAEPSLQGGSATAGESGASMGGSTYEDCPSSPRFSFLDGFEAYTGDSVLSESGSPWRALNPSLTTGDLGTAWVRSCSKDLFFQGPGPVLYVPLALPSSPAKLNFELWYAPSNGSGSATEFGLGSVNGQILSKIFSVTAQGTSLKTSTPWRAPTVVSDSLRSADDLVGRAPQNYVRVELDFCALQARVYVGTDSSAPLSGTVQLGGSDHFDAFYLTPGARTTYIDDLAIWTPGTALDRSKLCAARVLDSFASPGSRCSGLGWDGASLWLLDNQKTLYRMDDTGRATQHVDLDFRGYGLSWDGLGFWTRNSDGNAFGEQVVRLRPNGLNEPGPAIFAQHGFSESGSQAQWSNGAFWTVSSTYNTVRKWSSSGTELLNWTFALNASGLTALSAPGLLSKDDALYFGVGFWKNSADQDTGIVKYSLTGVALEAHNLSQLGIPPGLDGLSLASDGKTYWVCSEDSFDVWHVTFPF